MTPHDKLRLVAVLDTARALVSQVEAILGPEDEGAEVAAAPDAPVGGEVLTAAEPMGRKVFMSRVQRGTPRVDVPTPPVDPAA